MERLATTVKLSRISRLHAVRVATMDELFSGSSVVRRVRFQSTCWRLLPRGKKHPQSNNGNNRRRLSPVEPEKTRFGSLLIFLAQFFYPFLTFPAKAKKKTEV
jgi:hypothetical protein